MPEGALIILKTNSSSDLVLFDKLAREIIHYVTLILSWLNTPKPRMVYYPTQFSLNSLIDLVAPSVMHFPMPISQKCFS